jgi:(p)ppGpp synthase/HD superfamily hydrolase
MANFIQGLEEQALQEMELTICEAKFLEAKELAAEAHGEQKYGEHPYTYHLNWVEKSIRSFGYDPSDTSQDHEHQVLSWDLITAAWLHDIVEDTHITRADISKRFNHRIASLVWAVTNPQGGNRAWRASKVYPKIKNTPHALILKLGDRVANVESCVETGSGLINMYAKEWDGFQAKYRVKGEHDLIWKYIDKLIKENRSFKKPRRGKRRSGGSR